jgi:SAM-dependent methyltransferase
MPARRRIAAYLQDVGQSGRRILAPVRRAPRRLRWALEDRRLIAEQRRGVLGPAHLRWNGNSVDDNRVSWADWDWSQRGEEWSLSDEWKAALIDDVIGRWIPRGSKVVEIGPGAGRWSEALASRASRLILVDISERPLELCRERLSTASNVEYVLSAGTELPGIANGSIDAVWSFDVFVHLAPRDQAAYLEEIGRVLAPGGVAVVHTTPTAATVASCHRVTAGARRCRAACSRHSRHSETCGSSAIWIRGVRTDATTSVATPIRSRYADAGKHCRVGVACKPGRRTASRACTL